MTAGLILPAFGWWLSISAASLRLELSAGRLKPCRACPWNRGTAMDGGGAVYFPPPSHHHTHDGAAKSQGADHQGGGLEPIKDNKDNNSKNNSSDDDSGSSILENNNRIDDCDSDLNSNSNRSPTWINTYFQMRSHDRVKKRFCLAPNCSQNYATTTSHVHLGKHWLSQLLTSAPLRNSRFQFYPGKHIDCLIRYVIKGKQKYRILEQKEFMEFARSMDPSKKLISRNCLSIFFDESSSKLMDMVKLALTKTSHIALTTDVWSARKRSRSFSAITGHFLDDSMRMRNVVLDFEYMPHPHDAVLVN